MILAAIATPAPATPAPSAFSANGWRVECAAGTAKAMDCQTIEQIVDRDNGQVLLSVTVRVASGAKDPLLLLTLPLGISVEKPVTVTVGDGKATTYPLQTCTQQGCFAGDKLTASQIQQLRTQSTMRVAYVNLGGQTVTVTLPLAEFSAAYDKIAK